MAAKAPDQVGHALLDPPVVEFYSLNRITLAVLPRPLNEPAIGAAGNCTECLVVFFERGEDLSRCPAGELLHHRQRTTAVHRANAFPGARASASA
jgi:hypothetical protein